MSDEEKQPQQEDNEENSEYVGIIWGPRFLLFSGVVIFIFLTLFVIRQCTHGDMGGGVDGIQNVL